MTEHELIALLEIAPIDWESLTVNDFCSYGERIAEENRIQEEIIKRRIGLVANGGFYRNKKKGE